MTGTDFCVNKPHMSRSYLNHLVQGLHNKSTGCGASGAYALGPEEEETMAAATMTFFFECGIIHFL